MKVSWGKLLLFIGLAALQPAPASCGEDLETFDQQTLAQVRRQIESLGAADFKVREASARELEKLAAELIWTPQLTQPQPARRFKQCFISPLREACRHPDAEIRGRANRIWGKVVLPRPVGDGIAGWALYAAAVEIATLPPLLSYQELRALQRRETPRLGQLRLWQRVMRRECDRLTISNLALRNPKRTAERVLKSEFSFLHQYHGVKVVARAWGLKNFDEALAWCKILPKGELRAIALEEVLKLWPKQKSHVQALPLFKEFSQAPRSRGPREACCRIAGLMATRDGRAAIRWTDSLPWDRFRGNMYASIMESVAERNVRQAIELSGECKGDRDYAKLALVRWMAGTEHPIDPEFVAAIGNELRRKPARKFLFLQLSRRDLPQAIEKLKTIKDRSLYWSAVCDIAERRALTDPQKAIERVRSFGKVTDGANVWRAIAVAWARTNPVAAARFVRSIETQDSREWATRDVAKVWAKTNPSAAMAFVMSQRFIDVGLHHSRRGVMEEWGVRDPQSAAKWLAKHPEGVTTVILNRILAEQWAKHDLVGACRWAISLGNGEARAFALVGVAKGLLPAFNEL